MKFRFREEALEEVREIAEHYRAISTRLGKQFTVRLSQTIERIVELPRAWSRLYRGTRHLKMRQFPYFMIYQEHDGEIVFVAVTHVKRRRRYWLDRL